MSVRKANTAIVFLCLVAILEEKIVYRYGSPTKILCRISAGKYVQLWHIWKRQPANKQQFKMNYKHELMQKVIYEKFESS